MAYFQHKCQLFDTD